MITKKFRILTFALIFSGTLNIGLITAFAFSMFKDTSIAHAVVRSSQKEEGYTNSQVFGSMARLTFRELVSFLTNRDALEEGYTKRDLAVASLVAFHHFNLEKALFGTPKQIRTVQISKSQKIDVFPGLTEDQFEAIIRFAYQEKWPLTAKGLFFHLQSKTNPRDESLEQAFVLTPEFCALQLLFQKTDAPQEPATILNLISEGSFELLEKLARDQSQVLDFSIDKRRNFLLSYLALNSPTAAQLLLRTDFSFALKRLEDRSILDLLSASKRQTEEGTRFCVELLRSPRSDAILQAAAQTLYSYVGELPVAPIDPQVVLARFAPPESPVIAQAPKTQPAVIATSNRFHVVKEGESLWKISRQYKVKVNEIVQLNGLEKESLFPGMTLKLPQGTGSEPPR